MREGEFETCYTYAANHHIDPAREDYAYSENEWLAGYCAYRLGRFDTAVGHFEAFRDSVFTPISLGRAGYWLGRASASLCQPSGTRGTMARARSSAPSQSRLSSRSS